MYTILKLTTVLCVLRFIRNEPWESRDAFTISISVNGTRKGELYSGIIDGEPLEIFCSGSDHLEMLLGGWVLPTDVINSTTIRFYQEKSEKGVTTYYCRNLRTKKIKIARVVLDTIPEVKDFNCISKNLEILNCSWTCDTAVHSNFTLTFSVNGHNLMPCRVQYFGSMKYCVWDSMGGYGGPRYRQQLETYRFSMVACNSVGCTYETYNINHFSIVKPDSPERLRVVDKNTRNAVLEWSISNNMVHLLHGGVEHKIEYWFYGIPFRRVNASLPLRQRSYHFDLALPCANQFYEVKISIRPILATDDKFWSDPATIYFSTDDDIEETSNTDPACDIIMETPQVMVYFTRKLRESLNKEKPKLRMKYKLLKQKEDQIKKLFNDL